MRRLRRVIIVFGTVAALILPLAPSAQAGTFCRTFWPLNSVWGQQAIESWQCVTHTSDRGYRGYTAFWPDHGNFQIAGVFHVELKRNGVHVVNSDDWVNPVAPGCRPSQNCTPFEINTPWAHSGGGNYCSILWDQQTVNTWKEVQRYCHDLA